MVPPEGSRRYRLGQEYRDTGSLKGEDDQFLAWLNRDSFGMRNMGGVRYHRFRHLRTEIPAFIVLVSTDLSRGTHANPWEDSVDISHGQITYWGDAKVHPTNDVNDWPGNKALFSAYTQVLDGTREYIPPILHFSRLRSGWVKFNGLAVIDRLHLDRFEHAGQPVRNYRLQLTILDQEDVDVEWLHARRDALDVGALTVGGPESWRRYQRGGVVDRLKVWAPRLRSREQQLPESGSRDASVLQQVIGLTPVQFETAVVKTFEEMREVTHSITRTRHVVDGGFDFYGSFKMPPPLGYEIDFLGEAKRYKVENSVGPKEVSRLVARLERGDYGLFVTTSYFTRQAQEEVLTDGYPVRLFAGGDLVSILRELQIAQGASLSRAWLSDVESEAAMKLA